MSVSCPCLCENTPVATELQHNSLQPETSHPWGREAAGTSQATLKVGWIKYLLHLPT